MKAILFKWESPVGRLYLIAHDRALTGLYFRVPKKADHAIEVARLEDGSGGAVQILRQTVRELEEYFAAKRKTFAVPLERQGTEFQMKVWSELSKIPYGTTFSYRDIAKRIKSDQAVRAVGTANGRNPISIIVPCHRVIAADGTLGGYAGGLDIKTKLLKIEGIVSGQP